MKYSYFLAVALFFFSSLLGASGYAGIEIGNGRYVDYVSKLGGFQTVYPEDWKRYDLGLSVSFIENVQLANKVAASVEKHDEVQSGTDLETFAKASNETTSTWSPVLIDGHNGFASQSVGQGVIHVLKKPGEVFTLRYQMRDDKLSNEDLKAILSSIRFNSGN